MLVGLLVLTLLGAVGTVVGVLRDPQRALYGYLFAFHYWCGLVVSSLILLAIINAAGARWSVALRRMLETIASTAWLLPLLFLPIVAGMEQLFPWHGELTGLPQKAADLYRHRREYLNPGFFVARAAFYFLVWIAVGELLLRWSRRQDETHALGLTVNQRWLSAGALPFICFSFDFAVTDWAMSIEPHWSSSIFGLYVMAGAFLGALALLTVVSTLARGPNLYGLLLGPAHRASLGKLLLGFTAFWAYIGFCQYMVVWIANLPKEVPWFITRTTGGWAAVGTFILVGQWAFPFFVLLSKDLKVHRVLLGTVAGWILFAHAVDVYWMILPAIDRAAPAAHYADVASFAALGAALAAFALFRLRGHHTLPIGDPYLKESLSYSHL